MSEDDYNEMMAGDVKPYECELVTDTKLSDVSEFCLGCSRLQGCIDLVGRENEVRIRCMHWPPIIEE